LVFEPVEFPIEIFRVIFVRKEFKFEEFESGLNVDSEIHLLSFGVFEADGVSGGGRGEFMDVEGLVRGFGGFEVCGLPLAIEHMVDFDFVFVGGFGYGVNGIFLIDL
jgi:hypothetical protein